MKKKVSAMLLASAMIISCVSGCNSGGGSSQPAAASSAATSGSSQSAGSEEKHDPVTVQLASLQDTTGATEKILEDFAKEYPWITVDYMEFPGNSDDMKKGLITSLAAGQDDPDVFSMDVIWTTQFAAAGWLMDLTGKFDENEYLGGPLSTTQFNNSYWAIPNYTDVQLLIYRSDLIKTPPTSWDELVTMCKDNIGKNDVDYGFLYQAFQGEPIVCNALTFIKSNGGNDLVDGKPVINSPNTIEALKFMRSLIDDGISPEDVLSHKPVDSTAIFEQGKALFMMGWSGNYASLIKSDSSIVKDKVSATVLPKGPSGSQPGPTVGGWNMAINAMTDQPDASLILAKYLTGKDGQRTRTVMAATLPSYKALYDDKALAEEVPVFTLVQEALTYGTSRPNSTDYPTMSTLIATNLHKALSQTVPYEETLKTIEDGMKDLIK